MSPDEFQVFQANQERIKAAPQPQGEDEIAVTQDPSKFMTGIVCF